MREDSLLQETKLYIQELKSLMNDGQQSSSNSDDSNNNSNNDNSSEGSGGGNSSESQNQTGGSDNNEDKQKNTKGNSNQNKNKVNSERNPEMTDIIEKLKKMIEESENGQEETVTLDGVPIDGILDTADDIKIDKATKDVDESLSKLGISQLIDSALKQCKEAGKSFGIMGRTWEESGKTKQGERRFQ